MNLDINKVWISLLHLQHTIMSVRISWNQNMAIYTLGQISGASTRMGSLQAREFPSPCIHVHAKNSDLTQENKRSLMLRRTTEIGSIYTSKSSSALKLRWCELVEAFTLSPHEHYSFNSRGVLIAPTVMSYASQMKRLRNLWRASTCSCYQTRSDSIPKFSARNQS